MALDPDAVAGGQHGHEWHEGFRQALGGRTVKIGDVQVIGGIRVLCVPDYLLTRVGMDPGTVGIMLSAAAADSMIETMRKAGLIREADPLAPACPEGEGEGGA